MSPVRQIRRHSLTPRHFDIARCAVIWSIHYSTSKYSMSSVPRIPLTLYWWLRSNICLLCLLVLSNRGSVVVFTFSKPHLSLLLTRYYVNIRLYLNLTERSKVLNKFKLTLTYCLTAAILISSTQKCRKTLQDGMNPRKSVFLPLFGAFKCVA